MGIYTDLTNLMEKSIEAKLIVKRDRIYVWNRVLHLLGLDAAPLGDSEFDHKSEKPSTELEIPDILGRLIDDAVLRGTIGNVLEDKEALTANIMDCFLPQPSVIEGEFWQKYNQSPKEATDYFYQLSQNSNYIQVSRIRKNIHFKVETAYGVMDITVNLSKPEKDPEQIRRERQRKQDIGYPQCVLCKENEGYDGRTGHPARANHRIIRVPLLGEDWFLQYSPYVYYNEHSIVLSEEHRPMKISQTTFERLLAFTDKFPHYFIGSNADLPIVGGSILSHDHYQAGRYEFPMTQADDTFTFELNHFRNVSFSVLKWPMTVIRLRSHSRDEIVRAADHIRTTWKTYQDEEADIRAFSGKTPHNTITPIARIREELYELDLVLRNNRTSDKHPRGIFHPHEDVQHIKKENIGLIEVMGLAVLPGRLKDELEEIKQYLLGHKNDVPTLHNNWADSLKDRYGDIRGDKEAETTLKKELGQKFARVLEDASVFKERKEMERFIEVLNL
ncbi:UDP-glucose--hexose-1-phosphate uridylyltransferase [Lentibacillus sp. CBA3610]|uniref:UDP-glucose--hexose-1-phosphate uridylyltransferase n=1 Tax=Lentibacillus sp. CBA3610 TaxID=2518176 RepID=UPI0015959A90|nr:UDP-glucose--hexose-1-phosphate uridylyltransferase [Lentibacillus sp. CBA3610]QKY70360.1 UDP-glucose--hexose-1-phosphate uridylyltransferase [Lentibacillus sp. CBA3610]